MTTKKQRREACEAKRLSRIEAEKQMGLRAQEKARKKREQMRNEAEKPSNDRRTKTTEMMRSLAEEMEDKGAQLRYNS